MRNHKNLTFWDDIIKVLVRSYRFATSLPANDSVHAGCRDQAADGSRANQDCRGWLD